MFWTRSGRDWDPFDEMRRLQRELNRAFDRTPFRTQGDFPAVNLWNGSEDYVLTAELPGIRGDSLDVSVLGDTVTIRGLREPYELKKGETFHRRERGHGQFVRSFRLPRHIDSEGVKAGYSRGILKLTLPRAEEDKPRKIPLKTA